MEKKITFLFYKQGTITEADELLKTKSDHIKDDEDPKGNYSEEEVPDPNGHIAAKEVCLNNQTVS